MFLPKTQYDCFLRKYPAFRDCVEPVSGSVKPFPTDKEVRQAVAERMFKNFSLLGVSRDRVRVLWKKKRQQMEALRDSLDIEFRAFIEANKVFCAEGKKTFYFSDSLADDLLITDMNVDARYFRAPFKSLMLVYSSRQIVEAFLRLYNNGVLHKDFDLTLPLSAVVDVCTSGDNTSIGVFFFHGEGETTCVMKTSCVIGVGRTIDESCAAKSLTQLGEDTYQLSTLLRLVINSILYLSSRKADCKEILPPDGEAVETVKKPLKEAGRVSSLPYCLVGGSKAVTGGNDSGRINAAFKERFTVRGHWRLQAHGENFSLKRLIWIEPFEKGPDIVDLINKPYLVK